MIHSCCLNKELKIELFSYLTDEELSRIDQNTHCTSYKKGDLIFNYGSPLTHIIFLIEGYVKIYRQATINKNLVLAVSKPVNYLGGPGFFYGGINYYSAQALTPIRLCYIEKNVFKDILLENSEFSMCFFKEFSKRAINTLDSFIDMTHLNMEARISKLLLYLSKVIFEKTEFDFLLSRQDVADYCAMTKESAIRILKGFEKDNIISLHGNNVKIIDIKRLEFIVSIYKPKLEF